jgi:hypothetical protein
MQPHPRADPAADENNARHRSGLTGSSSNATPIVLVRTAVSPSSGGCFRLGFGQLFAQAGCPVCSTYPPAGGLQLPYEEWGNSTSSHFAGELIDLCGNLQWDILNCLHSFGVPTRPAQYARSKSSSASIPRSSIIDLGVTSHPELVHEFRVLQLDDTPLHSDHRPHSSYEAT